jgi:hypothetical protein
LKAASATPGVVAGNDVVLAQKAVEADQGQIAAARQNVEAAREALKSVSVLLMVRPASAQALPSEALAHDAALTPFVLA